MTIKGSYSASTSYSVGDIVLGDDGFWYMLTESAPAGTPLNNTKYWERKNELGIDTLQAVVDYVATKSASTVTGKIKNNLTTTGSGYALDARQGKALSDSLKAVNPDAKTLVLQSSTAESVKKFAITVDDDGELTATEIVEGS